MGDLEAPDQASSPLSKRCELLITTEPLDAAADVLARAILAVLEVRDTARVAVPGGSALPALAGACAKLGDAVARVEAGLRVDFDGALDVLLLGMGEDGHIASLFPWRSLPESGLVAHVSDSPKPPPDRITLTPAALATASRAVLAAFGESKRAPLRKLLAGDPTLPAQALKGLVVVTDLDLAAA